MQKAIPYKSNLPLPPPATAAGESSGQGTPAAGAGQVGKASGTLKVDVHKMVMENPIIVFGQRGCCMCHVIMKLLHGLGVNPAVYEVAEEHEAALGQELLAVIGDPDEGKHRNRINSGSSGIINCNGNIMQFPAVFVGGKLFGGLDRVMATHISGELHPILREAGALWL